MLNNKEIIALASDTAISDSRQTKIASDVLKIFVPASQDKKNVPAKMQKQNGFKIDFTDGGYISYDASISKLDIYCPGEISINGKFLRLQEEKLNVSN